MEKTHMHNDTFLGLHKWECYLFEKLGWIAKAMQQGNELKVKAYLESINKLEMALHNKITQTHSPDRRGDLHVLLNNLDCLKHCSTILFHTSKYSEQLKEKDDSYKEGCEKGKEYESTFQSLHCWMRAKYEKLGRMCLARTHGNNLCPKAYLDSLKNLKASLEQKLEELNEKDRKDDIMVLINYTCFLQKIAHILLVETEPHKMKPMKSMSHRSKRSTKKHSLHNNNLNL